MSPEFVALSDRVAALEQAVARLQAHLGPPQEHWLDRMRRGVTDVEAFEEALRLGREFRQSYREDIQADQQP
jgi:hypothetical protein